MENRMKKLSIPILMLVSFIFISATGGSNTAAAPETRFSTQLLQNENKWSEQRITNYRIEVLVVNSIWHAQTHIILVQNGTVINSTATCIPAPIEAGMCKVRPFDSGTYTVAGLFSQARLQMNGDLAPWIAVHYDPVYGFPGQISYNNPNIIDGDWTWRVTAFEITP
jgi:hypothetical protein